MRRIQAAILLSLAAAAPAHAAGCDVFTRVTSPDVSALGDNTFAAVDGLAANDVWAVGQFAPGRNLNITLTYTAHYDGTAWSAVPSPNIGAEANALHGVAALPGGHAVSVGYYIDGSDFVSHTMIQFWDGTAWRVVAHPADPGPSAVFFGVAARSADDIWAVGEYERPIDGFHTLTEHFDGTRWSVVPSPDDGTGDILLGVAVQGSVGAWAVGERSGRSEPDRALILVWNGARWSPVRSPPEGPSSTRLYSVAGDAAGRLHAAGEAEDDARREKALTELETPGHAVNLLATAQVGLGDNHLFGIGAAPDGTSWAVGAWFDPATTRQSTLAERADAGGHWTIMPSPSPSHAGDSILSAVAAVEHDVWAVGAFDGPQGMLSLILHSCR